MFLTLALFSLSTKGQYPFEKYPTLKYQKYNNWKFIQTKQKIKTHGRLTIHGFFDNKDDLTIQLTTFCGKKDSSFITIYRNKKLLQKVFEPMFFNELNIGSEPVKVADINGDHLKDLKLVASYLGNGVAAMNVRVIFLFQNSNNHFTKISFIDKNSRLERDFNNDDNFEIITMTLKGYKGHSYWLFNLFDYNKGRLVSANEKANYPIMVQYLYQDNYKITDKINTYKMKDFAMELPEGYDKR